MWGRMNGSRAYPAIMWLVGFGRRLVREIRISRFVREDVRWRLRGM